MYLCGKLLDTDFLYWSRYFPSPQRRILLNYQKSAGDGFYLLDTDLFRLWLKTENVNPSLKSLETTETTTDLVPSLIPSLTRIETDFFHFRDGFCPSLFPIFLVVYHANEEKYDSNYLLCLCFDHPFFSISCCTHI